MSDLSSCSCGQSDGSAAPSRTEFIQLQRQIQSLEQRFGLLAELTGEAIRSRTEAGAEAAPAAAGREMRLAARSLAGAEGRGMDADHLGRALARIIGGVPSRAGDFDDCALLELALPNGRSSLCSGVLVGKRVVLSAAHCAHASSIMVHLGCSSLDDIRAGKAESIPAKKWVVHEHYRAGNSPAIHDLMVVILSADARTQPVKMAEAADLTGQQEVMLVGFGSAHLNASAASAGVKRQVTVPLTVLRRQPDEDLDQEETYYGFESDTEFVAGKQGFDTCQGDSGGPVYVLDGGGQRLVCGLTSRYALLNGRPPSNVCGSGGIYTRVDAYTDWIIKNARRYMNVRT